MYTRSLPLAALVFAILLIAERVIAAIDDVDDIALRERDIDYISYFEPERYNAFDKRSSPTGGYTPGNVTCPNLSSFVRNATSLAENETLYIENRHAVTTPYLIDYLDRLNLTDFNATDFLVDTNVTIGLAFSGGGYRAMLSGAGFLAAFDARTPNATDDGHIGGLLQSSTYITGLSGGSWLVTSVAINDYPTIRELQGSDTVWDLSNSILNPGGWQVAQTTAYYSQIIQEVDGKRDAGFDVSLTDYWGRGLAFQLFNYTDGGPGLTFSDIRNLSTWQNYSMPYPIVVADGRPYNTNIVSLNSTVYEFSPYELGSWDPSLYSFAVLDYIGTNMTNGQPQDNASCIKGFDNAGFVIGTSSTLFNQFLLQLNDTGIEGVLYEAAQAVLEGISAEDNDIAPYEPNPFFGVNPNISYVYNETQLTLVDGGEDYQNIPLAPLIQPVRQVDVIFAIDNSADTNSSWPAGWSMTATYDRQFTSQANGTKFPAVPDRNTFVGMNLTARPTWFGCNASNITGENGGTTVPLIVYLANYPWTYYSNTSTFQLSYDTDEVDGIITNGYNVATQGNGTVDTEWARCVGCAIIHRETERRNQTPTAECQACLSKYCWNGTVLDSQASQATAEPSLVISEQSSSDGATMAAVNSVVWGVVVLGVVAGAML
ncbi:lysophospholipase catalytic domain-containing protein [Lipomyces tetrasporus]|uniref:Lysophospholipase n=1 Tax=Lipomyces tetrasporus TaxID=54092 RepID=A0AAD7QWY0_9ASCO|nr:lysophospholipase catalytic domain-containing protein [Lipomyces tetrasporus]KAJ8102736.1 lysophospholipase catalytic domain-containing protein [Lipomyces tetrasporus]